jgi:DNA-binding HxlR family transcriptional regulator
MIIHYNNESAIIIKVQIFFIVTIQKDSGGMFMPEEYNQKACPIEKTMHVIGGKWTFIILRELFYGPRRFGELQRSLKGISPRTLSMRLKELEEEGIISRTIYSEIPPHVEYALTEKGKTLRPVFDAMKEWGNAWDVLKLGKQ